MTEPLYRTNDKQLLRGDREHIADCASEEIASALASVLNGQVLLDMPLEQQQRLVEVLWP